jgi:hypothetical protein
MGGILLIAKFGTHKVNMSKEIRCINKRGFEVFIPESLANNASYMSRNELQVQDIELMKREVEGKSKTFNHEIVAAEPAVAKKEETKVEKNTKK